MSSIVKPTSLNGVPKLLAACAQWFVAFAWRNKWKAIVSISKASWITLENTTSQLYRKRATSLAVATSCAEKQSLPDRKAGVIRAFKLG